MTTATGLMKTLVRGNPNVLGVLVVDGDGRVQAGEGTSSGLLQAASALAVPLRELLDRTVAELGCGAMSTSLVEGTEATLVLADVDGMRTVVIVGAAGAPGGALRADAIWAASALRRGVAA